MTDSWRSETQLRADKSELQKWHEERRKRALGGFAWVITISPQTIDDGLAKKALEEIQECLTVATENGISLAHRFAIEFKDGKRHGALTADTINPNLRTVRFSKQPCDYKNPLFKTVPVQTVALSELTALHFEGGEAKHRKSYEYGEIWDGGQSSPEPLTTPEMGI